VSCSTPTAWPASRARRRPWCPWSPGSYLPWISPTPLLLVAVGDHLVPSELAIAAFDKAHQPEELIIMPGGHFDAYTAGLEASSGPARDWFLRHLSG
jgi:hypothetical protein